MSRIRVVLTILLVIAFVVAVSEVFGLRQIIQHALAFITSLDGNSGVL